MGKNNSCAKCTGLCCRYFALPIETPEDEEDYDDIRWYLCHEEATVFVEDGDWYLNVKNTCRYLSEEDYRCEAYGKRPKICRDYRRKDCDLAEGEYDYELHFTDDKQMAEYIKMKFSNNVSGNNKQKRRKPKKKAKKR